MTDRNGTTHAYSYDVLGRQTADAVTILGAGVDGAVQRIETAYDTQGNAYLFTSYDAPSGGNIVNQVERLYNGLGQLVTEYQSHSGPVEPGSTPSLQYAYTEMAGSVNNSRLVSMTYPNGRVLHQGYNAGVDDAISRLSFQADDDGSGIGTHLEEYSYLGLSTVVKRAHPESGVDLTYIQQPGDLLANTDGGDQYTGLDRFSRVIDQLWVSEAGGNVTDRFQYGYDRDGNRLYQANLVTEALGLTFDELYHASGAGNGYDGLNRLTDFSRGALNASRDDLVGGAVHGQSWQLDGLGNWNAVTTDGSTQSRTHNVQNQITSISGAVTPGYDANGNTTGDETGKGYVYDAWNRLVQVNDANGNPLETFAYDGLNRRIIENSGTARDLYSSSAWQVVEEQVGGVMQAQYVWSPVYVDAMVERDTSDGVRLYVQQDANWNVTAVVSSAGVVQERYVYDPYGQATVLDAGWNTLGGSTVGWVYLHQGGRFDAVSGLYNFRNRDYSATLGRWMQQDPMGYVDGYNLYEFVRDRPIGSVDSYGLQSGRYNLGLTFQGTQPKPVSDYGGAIYSGHWQIAANNQNGFIVQHVVRDALVRRCCGKQVDNPHNTHRDYWEYWPLPQSPGIDAFLTVDEGSGTTGIVTMTGRAAFFLDLPKANWAWNPDGRAALLMSTTTAPEGWNDADAQVVRVLTVDWHDCDPHRWTTRARVQ
jgi:RHS repeat-associated protein